MLTRRASRTAALLAGSIATLLVVSACSTGTSGDQSGTDGSDPTSTDGALLGSVDTMFGTVEVPEPDDGELSVVALGWSDAEMALALGVAPIAVFDWQGFGVENNGVGPWAADEFTGDAPTIIERGDQSLNYEQIAALDPDLILNVRSSNDEEEYQRLAEIAPTVYAPEGTGAFATSWDVQMTSISEALGEPDAGADAISKTKDAIVAAKNDHPEFDGLTVSAGAKFADAYGAYLAGDGRFDILGDLGFVNAPAVTELESSGFFANVSAEQVSALDADVATMLPIGFTKAETVADPLLSSLPVFADGRAIVLDPDEELAGAYGASSVLSIPVVLDQLVPMLADAAAKVS